MDGLPFTRNRTSPPREEAIRSLVRSARTLPSSGASNRVAGLEDAPALFEFLEHPDVNQWIYSLPRPLTFKSVEEFILSCEAGKARGEAHLSLNFDEAGRLSGYTELHVWPKWAAGEVAGAMRPDLQNKGQGGAGMAALFSWMFDELDLDLICNTTALNNVRIQALFQKTGFTHVGNVESPRPDGSFRPSQVWEITRDAWFERLGTY